MIRKLSPLSRAAKRRRLVPYAAFAALLTVGMPMANSNDQGPYPGLPYHAPLGTVVPPEAPLPGSWTGVAQVGVSEAAKAQQWARIPAQLNAAVTSNVPASYPPDDPRQNSLTSTNSLYFVADKGSDHNYGISAPFTVRTSAFGSIPVEATLELRQRRTADGLPAAIIASASEVKYRTQVTVTEDTIINDTVTVRLRALRVDGVDLGLQKGCQPSAPARLHLVGRGWTDGDPDVNLQRPWLSGHYKPGSGGTVRGTVDIPPFSGCVTRMGEDISPLLSSAVSGDGNAVELNVTGPKCGIQTPGVVGSAPPPGRNDVTSCGVSMVPEIPLPARQ